jgi:NitT/TauT family transport system substrate-binding protein
MRKLGAVALMAALALGLGSAAHAADKLTLQLKWVTQSQFAG